MTRARAALPNRRPVRSWLGVLLALALADCGKGTGSVAGTVHHQGKIVRSGFVLLVGADGAIRSAPIGADGTYAIANIPSGTVRVGVRSPERGRRKSGQDNGTGVRTINPRAKVPAPRAVPSPLAPQPDWFALPKKYEEPTTSGLTYELSPGPSDLDIDLP